MWNVMTISGYGEIEATTLVAGTYWTNPVRLADRMTSHAFQCKVASAGAGTVTITPYTSVSQHDWVSSGTKLSSATKTSGPDGDGLLTIPMSINPGEFIKFKIVIGTADTQLTLEFVQK